MIKIMLGFLIGCFFTYNYIVGDPVLEPIMQKTNIWMLQTVQTVEVKLRNNIDK